MPMVFRLKEFALSGWAYCIDGLAAQSAHGNAARDFNRINQRSGLCIEPLLHRDDLSAGVRLEP